MAKTKLLVISCINWQQQYASTRLLKVLNNTFWCPKTPLGTAFNQVKGLNLFVNLKKVHDVDIVKNTEVIYYMRNDDKELMVSTKTRVVK
jgi:hypothetical protein